MSSSVPTLGNTTHVKFLLELFYAAAAALFPLVQGLEQE